MRFLPILALASCLALASTLAGAQDTPAAITADAINAADLTTIAAAPVPSDDTSTEADGVEPAPAIPDPAIAKLQILLDRLGASPGVIDGFDGDNVRKAVRAVQTMAGLEPTGEMTPDLLQRLDTAEPVVGAYTITADDVAAIVPPIPEDYAEQAKRDFLGYTSVREELAERFHMDEDLLAALNPATQWGAGEQIAVAGYGPDKEGKVARIEADKSARQLRAYDADGALLVAYPATIGSTDNPSPTGTHLVQAVAPMPNYTYNPEINFKQGDNDTKLIIPPGPNGPVGSMWIDLTEPTFGIHGTPQPSRIDKTQSHGCIRLTNWDAEELAKMVEPGVPVEFVG
jgi:lipoprotein-anchoring transpeptidase ErfK/SrfK